MILRTIREAIDGLRALPRIALDRSRVWYLNCLVDERDATIERTANDLMSVRRWLKESNGKLRDEEERHAALQSRCYEGFASATDGIFDALRETDRQLSAERDAHDELSVEYRKLAESNARTSAQLSATRADLEALTKWRLQSEEPCPVPTFVEVSINSPRLGICLDRCGTLEAPDSWRFTPESLAAWKAREGGGE